MKTIFIHQHLSIPMREIIFQMCTSSGPGGQHVNKTSTKVILRWNLPNSNVLTDKQRELLQRGLARYSTKNGDIIIRCTQTRSQKENKHIAITKLIHLLQQCFVIKPKRRKTRPSKSSIEKRLKKKKQTSLRKKERSQKYTD